MYSTIKSYRLSLVFLLLTCGYLGSPLAGYIKLPDGKYYEAPEGFSAAQAYAKARQDYPESFGLNKIPQEKKFDATFFNECKLDVVKNTRTVPAMAAGIDVCEKKAVPKKCRVYEVKKDYLGNESGADRIRCVQACSQASVFSRKFGDCSPG